MPVSPVISTVASVVDDPAISSNRPRIAALAPIELVEPCVRLASSALRSRLTSPRSARCSIARATTQRAARRRSTGLVMKSYAPARIARDRGLEAAVRGDHDDRHVGPVGDDALAQLEPVHPGHLEVGDDDIEVFGR